MNNEIKLITDQQLVDDVSGIVDHLVFIGIITESESEDIDRLGSMYERITTNNLEGRKPSIELVEKVEVIITNLVGVLEEDEQSPIEELCTRYRNILKE